MRKSQVSGNQIDKEKYRVTIIQQKAMAIHDTKERISSNTEPWTYYAIDNAGTEDRDDVIAIKNNKDGTVTMRVMATNVAGILSYTKDTIDTSIIPSVIDHAKKIGYTSYTQDGTAITHMLPHEEISVPTHLCLA